MTIHIHNSDRAIILHSNDCDEQPRYHGNQYTTNKCEPDCRCVSKQNYSPSPVTSYPTPTCYCCTPVYGCPTQYPATNTGSYGCSEQFPTANAGSSGCPTKYPATNAGSVGCSTQYPPTNAGSCGCYPIRDVPSCGGLDRGYSTYY